MLAPRGTPEAFVKELSGQMLKVAATEEFQSRLGVEGAVPLLGGSSGYAALIRKESAQWAESASPAPPWGERPGPPWPPVAPWGLDRLG